MIWRTIQRYTEMSDKRDVQISKALSYLLRHGAEKEKLSIDSQGYIAIQDILSNNRIKTHRATLEDIERIVAENNKKRFTLTTREGKTYICANQGHSLTKINNDNLELVTDFPPELIHGTTHKNLKLILESGGLSKMNRNHIHLTSHLDQASESKTVTGIRAHSSVLIYLDIPKLREHNIKVYKSLNDVYLSEGVDGVISCEFFLKIVDRKSMKVLDI